MAERPGLVIFDCDGVLVDSEPITNRILSEQLTRYGLPTSEAECAERWVGGTVAGIFREAQALGAPLPDDWVEATYAIYFETLGREVEPVPGVTAVLDRLDAAGIRYCVASNGPVRKMEVTLGRCRLTGRFGGRVYSAHVVGATKPEPGLFLHAAAMSGARPAGCVVIGDSPNDALAARAAGMRCLGYCRDTPAARLAALGAETFDDMAALPALLGLTAESAAE
jgi:HAD superfamily hydrolase (TIGR01509 family)